MTALAEPSAAPPASARVSQSVSPAQAAGTPETTTEVMFPLLSTERIELSELTPHEVTGALPAESVLEPSARVAAAPHAAKTAATARVNPSMWASRFIVRSDLLRVSCRRAGAPPPAPRPATFVRRY